MADQDLTEKKKIFSYREAVALLPYVQQLTEDAHRRVEAIEGDGESPLSEAAQRDVDRIVSAWAYALIEKGIEVKGRWLIDFDNGSGYYCWRYPESGLHFFHSYEDGFRGRMPIQ
jgi:hypothetical protein